MNTKEEKRKIDAILSQGKKILITSHKNPDLDAVCSTIAFKWYVDKYFPKSESAIFFTAGVGELKDKLSFTEGASWLKEVDDISHIIKNYDVAVFLDGSELHRFTKLEEELYLKEIKTICIDHHKGDPYNFDYLYRDFVRASCVELVCEILLSNEDLQNRVVAEAVFLGIHSDTGGFSFVESSSAQAFAIAQRSVEQGHLVVQNLLQHLSGIKRNNFELLKKLMINTVIVDSKSSLPSYTYSYFNKDDIKGLSEDRVKPARAIYVFEYLRKIEGYSWGFVVTPVVAEKKYGLSLRSVPGSINVQELGKIFNGGGHMYAAGGNIFASTLNLSEDEFEKLDGEQVSRLFIEKIEEAFKDGKVTLTGGV